MITLYVLNGCHYCARVLETLDELQVPHETKEINDPGVTEELIARGGKRQVPYIVDPANGTEMYESEDIVAYLHERFPKAAVG